MGVKALRIKSLAGLYDNVRDLLRLRRAAQPKAIVEDLLTWTEQRFGVMARP